MELNFEPADGLSVHHVETHTVVVGERTFDTSFLLTPEQIVEAWSGRDATQLDRDCMDPVLALQPELVILGSGQQQQFPPADVQALFLSRGIGLECMDNAAAARTFNLLAAEGRRVVAAFILPASQGH